MKVSTDTGKLHLCPSTRQSQNQHGSALLPKATASRTEEAPAMIASDCFILCLSLALQVWLDAEAMLRGGHVACESHWVGVDIILVDSHFAHHRLTVSPLEVA